MPISVYLSQYLNVVQAQLTALTTCSVLLSVPVLGALRFRAVLNEELSNLRGHCRGPDPQEQLKLWIKL